MHRNVTDIFKTVHVNDETWINFGLDAKGDVTII